MNSAAPAHTPCQLRHLYALLVLSFVFLLPAKTLFNVPTLIMATAGLWVLWVTRRDAHFGVLVRRLCLLFALLWVPLLVAATSAVDATHALKAAVLYPRLLLAAVFIVYALGEPQIRRWVTYGAFAICVFWTLDAAMQFIIGVDVLGYPYKGGQLRGIFYPKYRLGMSLAVFVPLLLDLIFRQRVVHMAWAALLPVMLGIVALTLHRNSWLMLALSLSAYALFVLVAVRWRPRPRAVMAAVAILAIGVGFASTQGTFKARLVPSVSALFEERAELEAQLGQRPDIWRTAIAMFRGNWLTGVGPRSFREAYEDYAAADDYWLALQPPQIPMHPHQIGLEVAAETGLFGVAGFVGAYLMVFWWWRRGGAGKLLAAPWLLGAAVMASPTNISKAFYGSVTASFVWWLLAVGLAVLWATAEHGAGATDLDEGTQSSAP